MKNLSLPIVLASAAVILTGCQAAQSPTGGPGFEQDPTASGSRFSEFTVPGSRMGMQNVDLED